MFQPQVLIIVAFQDESTQVGEASPWIEHYNLVQKTHIPGIDSPIYSNSTQTIALLVTGMGKSQTACSISLLAASDRIDVHDSYLLFSGIAGGNPKQTSAASVCLVTHVADANLASHIHASELPLNWRYEQFKLGSSSPWGNDGFTTGSEYFMLNLNLVDTCFKQLSHLVLNDSSRLKNYRDPYQQCDTIAKPHICKGGSVSGDSFFHGQVLGAWAEWWLQNWSAGEANYLVTSMEDSALAFSVKQMHRAQLMNYNKLILLRAVSNYDRPYPSQSCLESLNLSSKNGLPIAMNEAIENLRLVGCQLIEHFLSGGSSK